MSARPAVLYGAALAVALALALPACTTSDQLAEPSAEQMSATTPQVATTTTTTVALLPCPLDIKASVTTTAKTVDIPGRTDPGHTVTVAVPSPESVPIEADGSFTYAASGYPKGTTANAVVVRVEGPGCVPVERGVEIVRSSPPTTTKSKSKGRASNDDYTTIESNGPTGHERVYDPDHTIRNGGSDPERCIHNGKQYCMD